MAEAMPGENTHNRPGSAEVNPRTTSRTTKDRTSNCQAAA